MSPLADVIAAPRAATPSAQPPWRVRAPDGRLSRPTATRALSRAEALPGERVYVVDSPCGRGGQLLPEAANVVLAEIVAGKLSRLGWGLRLFRCRVHAVSCGFREIEQPVGPDAKEPGPTTTTARGPSPPIEIDTRVAASTGLRFM